MKQLTLRSLVSRREWRIGGIILLSLLLVWVGLTPSSAQLKNPKRVTSVRAADAPEGSKVTVVSDSALNDYEAYRRGDRFYVKVPEAGLAATQPKLRGNGFEDGEVQKTGDGIIFSFRLQPGTAARVNQRMNRLDVIFSTPGKSQNTTAATARVPNTTSGQTRATDVAGPVPPGSTRNSRNAPDSREGVSAQTRNADSNSRVSGTPNQNPDAGRNTATNLPRETAAATPSISALFPTANSISPAAQAPAVQAPSPTRNATTGALTAAQRQGSFSRLSALNWLLLLGLLVLFGLAWFVAKRKGVTKNLIAKASANRWKQRLPGTKPRVAGESVLSEPVLPTPVAVATEPSGALPTPPFVPAFAEAEKSYQPAPPPPVAVDSHRVVTNPLFAAAPLSTTKPYEFPAAAPAGNNSSTETNPLFAAAPWSPSPFERTNGEVKKLLAGSHYDTHLIDAADSLTRQEIAAQLLAAIASPYADQHGPARRAFLDHGYFDDLTRDLRTADSPAERSNAATKIGQVGTSHATAHLIAALYDSAPEVRRSAVEALSLMADPTAIPALNDLLARETSRQLPTAMIREAIDASATRANVTENSAQLVLDTPASAEPVTTAPVVPSAPVIPEVVTPAAPLASAGVTAPAPAEKWDDKSGFQAFEREAFREFMESRVAEQARAIDAAKLTSVAPQVPLPPAEAPTPVLPLWQTTPPPVEPANVDDDFAAEEARLMLQEQALRRAAEALEGRRLAAENAKKTAEANAQLQAELEARIQSEAAEAQNRAVREAREQAELDARRRIEQEAARRFAEEEARRTLEAQLLIKAEAEAARRAEEENRFRLEAETLRRAAEELARKRLAAEAARKAAEEEARVRLEAEARRQAEDMTRLRIEEEARRQLEETARRQLEEETRRRVEEEARRLAAAEAQLRADEERKQREAEAARYIEEERLSVEREALLEAAAELTRRRAEVEQARMRAAEEARLLLEAKERIRIEDEKRRLVEEEHKRITAEAQRRAAEENERIAEARRLAIEEQQKVQELARLAAEEEERRLSELENVRRQAEERARQRAQQEARIRAEIEVLRQAEEAQHQRLEAETRRRAEAETRLKEEHARRQAEEAARLKVEEEARQKAEQEVLLLAEETRLRAGEEARRRADAEARLRAEEERLELEVEARLKAEEDVRRLAAEARQRTEDEAHRRAEAEAELQAEQGRLFAEAEARATAEAEARRLIEEARAKIEVEARLRAEQEVRALTELDTETHVEAAEEILAAPFVAVENSASAFDVVIERNENPPPVISTPVSVAPSAKGIEVVASENGIEQLSEESSIPSELLTKFNSSEPFERSSALAELAQVGGDDAFRFINRAFDDQVADVRNAAAQALYNSQPDRAASFTRALRESSPERRRTIGAALATSGLANEAIANLTGESREKTYDAFSLLFLMAKAGEVRPLMDAIEEHESIEVRLAVVKLLALSGQAEIVPAFRRLAVRGSLPTEVRSAVMEAIYQISSQSHESAPVA